MLFTVLAALYLQVRETVGEEIQSHLQQQICDGFNRLFSAGLDKRIEEGFDIYAKKMLTGKN